MTDILAIDLATWCGWCRGRVGEQPVFGSLRFGSQKDVPAATFAAAISWLNEMLARPPDLLMLEQLLPPNVMQGRSQRRTFARLGGLQAIALGLAHEHRVGEICEASVGDVRGHFIGERALRREAAKKAVVERCRRLGWAVANDNEGDACALWSYGCALIDPRTALRVVPLFNRRLTA
jgi:crossover junction endodeoxyribonuclease RuvC